MSSCSDRSGATAFEVLEGLTATQLRLLGKLAARRTVYVSGSLIRTLRALADRSLASVYPTERGMRGDMTARGYGVAAEHVRRSEAGQCPAMSGPSRGGTIVFCTKYRGHVADGDPEHVGFRRRWS